METQTAAPPPLIAARGVTRRYGASVALKPTDFVLSSGECVAIIGENGAGKSTLAKILTGSEIPDDGSIEIAGTTVTFHSPRDALKQGVALIPQELANVPDLTVAENVMLNRLPSRFGATRTTSIHAAAVSLMQRVGLWVDPTARMGDLGVSDQQIVEIVKALGRESRVLVLDEPTAALSDDEARKLYALLEELRGRGIGVVVISHHLDQVRRFSTRIDVFRDGQLVLSAPPCEHPSTVFIQAMLGSSQLHSAAQKIEIKPGARVLGIEGWSVAGKPGLDNVSLELRQGEVLGVYGIRGAGSELLAQGLGGTLSNLHGSVLVTDQRHRIFRSPRQALRAGIAYVPADRKVNGLVLSQSIRTSVALLILRRLATWGCITSGPESVVADAYATAFRLRYADLSQQVGQLSGGNQQKVLLASRLATSPTVLVAHEPTRGVDIGARQEIHQALRDLAADETGVLVVSSDVEEVVEISDRLLVIRDGRIVAELTGAALTQTNAVRWAAA